MPALPTAQDLQARRPHPCIVRLLGATASALLAVALTIPPAHAADAKAPVGDNAGEPGLFDPARATLLGKLGGARAFLEGYGVTLTVTETSEGFGNLTGGIRRDSAYDGLTTAVLQVDTSKAFGLEGGTFNASALQIHGRNLSARSLLILQTISGIEAARATRLWELWYEQSFADNKVGIRLGQQSLDQEFLTSTGSALFANTAMGWPLLPSVDQYAGGPAYPLSSLGIRAKSDLGSNVTALLGVFDDNPPGGPFDDDAQTRGSEASGTRFNLGTGALVIGELQYALNQPRKDDGGKDKGGDKGGDGPAKSSGHGLPGVYKLGFWYDTGRFPNQRYDTAGLALASPLGNGVPRQDRGNFSVYGVVDQTVYKPDPDGAQAIAVFARVMGAPGDRNLVSFSTNAGVTLKAPFAGRDDDTFGVGFGYGRISNGARGFDRDVAAQAGPGTFSPVRSAEAFVEVTYQYQLRTWCTLQPDIQYIVRPGGGIVNPGDPTRRVGDEAVVGLRTTITF